MVARRTPIPQTPAHPGQQRPLPTARASPKREPSGFSTTLLRAATSRPAKAAYVAVGTVRPGGAGAWPYLGPKRPEQDVLQAVAEGGRAPGGEALGSGPARHATKLTGLFRKAGDEREKLARDFQSWIGHFRAS